MLEIRVLERAKISSVCFDVLLDDVFALELLFQENECCIVIVGPGAQLLGIVLCKTVGADEMRIEDFPANAETVALRETLNDWWRPKVMPGSWRHMMSKKLGCLGSAGMDTLHSLS